MGFKHWMLGSILTWAHYHHWGAAGCRSNRTLPHRGSADPGGGRGGQCLASVQSYRQH